MNVAVWVERQGRRRPDDPALADGDRVHASRARSPPGRRPRRLACARASGCRRRDRVAIVLRNRPEYVEALFAIWHAGLVAVPVNARLHPDMVGSD